MPKEITNEEGVVETFYTPEEVEAMKADSAKEVEEANNKFSEEKKTLEEKLKGFENKDFNFKKLRDMNEDEKAKLSETELSLKREQEKLAENQEIFTKSLTDSHKNEALAVLCGNDKDLKDKVLLNYNKIIGSELTKEEVFARARDAFNMLGTGTADINPLSSLNNMTGSAPQASQALDMNAPDYASNKVDPDLARGLGISADDLKNYDNHPFKGSSKETGKKAGFAKD